MRPGRDTVGKHRSVWPDLGRGCLQVHKRWVQNLEEEFFRQGDAEKRNDLPVSALFDREKPGVTKSQVSHSCAC
jgi:hypothetical protein